MQLFLLTDPQHGASEQNRCLIHNTRFRTPTLGIWFPVATRGSGTLLEPHLEEQFNIDLPALMDGLMSEQALNYLGLNYPDNPPSTAIDGSYSASPMTYVPTSGTLWSQTYASRVGRGRTEQWTLAEERAELERKRAKLAEMECELEDV